MADNTLESILPEAQAIAQRAMQRYRLPGAALGIVRGPRLAWSCGLGVANLEDPSPPDGDTVFRVASITKTFTAAALLQLRDRGALSLDDPLVLYLPEFAAVLNRHGPLEDVTIRRLLTHRSGLVSEAPAMSWDTFAFPSSRVILERIAEAYIAIRPDTAFKYSNLAFALLGEVASRVSGRPCEEYVSDEILGPLGMSSSGFRLTDDMRRRAATGYARDPFADRPRPANDAPLEGLAAAGGLYTTVRDLARWLSFQFSDGRAPGSGGPPVLSPSALAEMHRTQYVDEDWKSGHCLPWVARRFGDRVYLSHGGALPGFRSGIAFSKKHRTGVVLLTNLDGHSAPDRVPFEMLDAICKADDATPRPPAAPDLQPVPAEWAGLTGIYSTFASSLATVEFRDGQLRLAPLSRDTRSAHAPAILRPTGDANTFVVEGGRGAGEHAVFDIGPDGQARKFTLSGFVYRRLRMDGQSSA